MKTEGTWNRVSWLGCEHVHCRSEVKLCQRHVEFKGFFARPLASHNMVRQTSCDSLREFGACQGHQLVITILECADVTPLSLSSRVGFVQPSKIFAPQSTCSRHNMRMKRTRESVHFFFLFIFFSFLSFSCCFLFFSFFLFFFFFFSSSSSFSFSGVKTDNEGGSTRDAFTPKVAGTGRTPSLFFNVVDNDVCLQCTHFLSSQRQSIRTFPDRHLWASFWNFRPSYFKSFYAPVQVSNLKGTLVVNLYEFSHIFRETFSAPLTRFVTMFCMRPSPSSWYCMSFEDLGLIDTFTCLYDQKPVWLLPIVFFSTVCHQLLCSVLPETHQMWSSNGKLLQCGHK